MSTVAFGVTPTNPAYSSIRYSNNLSKVINIDCCIDIDVRVSGSVLTNLIPSPPDGSSSADGAMIGIGDPTLSGAGTSRKLVLDSNDAIQLLGSNTPCVQRFHKTTSSQPYWYSLIFELNGDDSGALVSTGDNNTDHGYVARRNSTNDKLVVRNFNGSSQSLLANDNGVFSWGGSSSTFIFLYTADPAAGDDIYWSNTRTGVVDTDTWVTTTTDATDTLTIGNVADLSEGFSSTLGFIAFACGLGKLNDTLAGNIIDHYTTRHSYDYVPT